jgi:hypothetical protein
MERILFLDADGQGLIMNVFVQHRYLSGLPCGISFHNHLRFIKGYKFLSNQFEGNLFPPTIINVKYFLTYLSS